MTIPCVACAKLVELPDDDFNRQQRDSGARLICVECDRGRSPAMEFLYGPVTEASK